ncbi:MAG: hypothetical protein NTZ27_04505 [Ignavibacteriales bacterium]|nr:hypothetical protein [Ignavibacteriales bacterium]
MKKKIAYVLLFSTLLSIYITSELKGQSGFKIELISTKLVNRVKAAFGGDWHSTDTTWK